MGFLKKIFFLLVAIRPGYNRDAKRAKYSMILDHRETLEMPLAHYFHLSRQGQNDHFMWDVLFVIFNKSKIILLNNS